MGIRVNIRGIRNVQRNAQQFSDELEKAVYGAMIKSALIDVETVAKKKLTQDLHVDTGRLRASIHTTYKEADNFLPQELANLRQRPVVRTHKYTAKILGKNQRKRGKKNPNKQFESTLTVNRKKYNIFVGTDVVYARKIEMLDSYLFFAFQSAKPKLNKRIKKAVKDVIGRTGRNSRR